MRKPNYWLLFLPLVVCFMGGCLCPPRQAASAGAAAAPSTRVLTKSANSWNGALLPAYPAGQPEITILRIVIPPGAKLPLHHHPVINAGVLLQGELTVITADGRTLQMKAGDPIVEVVNTVHYGINSGKVPAEIVVFYAGVTGLPVTVKEP